MPVITRLVQPAPNGVQVQHVGPSDDPLADAVPVSSLKYKHANVTIYGPNRVGKSTLACEFDKPLLILSFEPGEEGGSGSVRNVPGVSFIRVTSKSQAIAIARRLASDPRSCWHLRDGKWWPYLSADGRPIHDGVPFATHVVDTTTSLQDVILKELMGLEAVPVQLAWGSVSKEQYQARSEQAKEVLRLYRDLPANTVFVAQQRDHARQGDWSKNPRNDARPESFFGPDMGEATAKWMYDASDHVCYLHLAKEVRVVPGQPIEVSPGVFSPPGEPTIVETGRIVRRLRTMFHPNYMAGSRSGNWRAVPEWIEAASPKQMYDDVMRIIRGERAKFGHYTDAELPNGDA